MRTFKPVRYDPVERKLQTSDKNNDKKFAFITQETVVDYRPVEVSYFVLSNPYNLVSLIRRFPQSYSFVLHNSSHCTLILWMFIHLIPYSSPSTDIDKLNKALMK